MASGCNWERCTTPIRYDLVIAPAGLTTAEAVDHPASRRIGAWCAGHAHIVSDQVSARLAADDRPGVVWYDYHRPWRGYRPLPGAAPVGGAAAGAAGRAAHQGSG